MVNSRDYPELSRQQFAFNEKDIAELPDNIKKAMKLHFVDQMDEVLALALESPLPTVLPTENDVLAAVPATEISGNQPARQ